MKFVERVLVENIFMVELQKQVLVIVIEVEVKVKNVEVEVICNVKFVEEVIKVKLIFFVNVFYELCMLFNGVIGNLEFFCDSGFNREQMEMVDFIRVLVDLLFMVINDIFDFLCMEVDKMKLYIIVFNLEEMV